MSSCTTESEEETSEGGREPGGRVGGRMGGWEGEIRVTDQVLIFQMTIVYY